MSEPIRIRPATAADADVLLSLIDALADYEKLGARRMHEWFTYRLTADRLPELADAGPQTPEPVR